MVEVAASTATTTMVLIMEVEVVLEDEEVTMIGGRDLGRTLMDLPAGCERWIPGQSKTKCNFIYYGNVCIGLLMALKMG